MGLSEKVKMAWAILLVLFLLKNYDV